MKSKSPGIFIKALNIYRIVSKVSDTKQKLAMPTATSKTEYARKKKKGRKNHPRSRRGMSGKGMKKAHAKNSMQTRISTPQKKPMMLLLVIVRRMPEEEHRFDQSRSIHFSPFHRIRGERFQKPSWRSRRFRGGRNVPGTSLGTWIH